MGDDELAVIMLASKPLLTSDLGYSWIPNATGSGRGECYIPSDLFWLLPQPGMFFPTEGDAKTALRVAVAKYKESRP